MSIRNALNEIVDPGLPLRSAGLAQLTKLTDDERREFAETWPDVPVERRRQVLEQLMDLAEDNIELDFDVIFFEALDDNDPSVRISAIRGLWEHEHRDVIPRLISLVENDENAAVRAEAALALGRFVMLGEFEEARPRDVEAVTDALRRVVDDTAEAIEVRARAVESLGASSQPWARDIIHDAYDSGDPRLMTSAIHAMGRSADAYWIPTIIDELQNDDPEIRYEAASSAGMIEDEEAVPYLIDIVGDEDSDVREQVLIALGAIGGEEAIAALRELTDSPDERTREAAMQALEEAEFGDDPLGFQG